MGDTIWLAAQALGTLGIVIVLALLSWKQTRRMLERRRGRQSALARSAPDPNFVPDPEVTDPFHVTDAPHDPRAPADANPAQRATHATDPAPAPLRGTDRPGAPEGRSV